MKLQPLGSSDLQVSRIAYGCMPLGGSWDHVPLTDQTRKEALVSIRAALDQGINFFDHADIYCMGKSEEVFSAVWQQAPGLRQKIYVQSKCGIRFGGDPKPGSPHRFDFSYEHILHSVEGSLRRLQTDYLDCLVLHSSLASEKHTMEVWRSMESLVDSGGVRQLGISHCHDLAELEGLFRLARVKPAVVQNRFHADTGYDREIRAFCSNTRGQTTRFTNPVSSSRVMKVTPDAVPGL